MLNSTAILFVSIHTELAYLPCVIVVSLQLWIMNARRPPLLMYDRRKSTCALWRERLWPFSSISHWGKYKNITVKFQNTNRKDDTDNISFSITLRECRNQLWHCWFFLANFRSTPSRKIVAHTQWTNTRKVAFFQADGMWRKLIIFAWRRSRCTGNAATSLIHAQLETSLSQMCHRSLFYNLIYEHYFCWIIILTSIEWTHDTDDTWSRTVAAGRRTESWTK